MFYVLLLMITHKLSPTTSISELTLDLLQTTHLQVIFKIISFKAGPTSVGTHKGVVPTNFKMFSNFTKGGFKGTVWTCVVSVWAVVGKVCVHIAFLDFLVAFAGAVHIDIDTVPSSEV